ncbi:MAG: ABC transporter ATP-binding protein [Myxococcaceae bacterium]
MSAAISVNGLHKEFSLGFGVRKRKGLDGMTFDVEAGEIYGFLGPNGAGKTTSIKVLTGLLQQDTGTASIFGKPPTDAAARKRLGYLPESPVFYDHLTGREFVRFCGKLSGLKGPDLEKRIVELLERVGLSHAIDLQIRRYSKGMTQRVGIAQALIHEPDLVILDEPMSGLDPMGRADIRDLILSLKKQGKTVFFSTHIIPDVEVVCTRLGIVNQGKMIKVGTVQELFETARDAATEIVVRNLPSGVALSREGLKHEVIGERHVYTAATSDVANWVLKEALAAQAQVVSVNPSKSSLEDLVVRLLAENNPSAPNL